MATSVINPVVNGAKKLYQEAVGKVETALSEYGESKKVEFPDTAYSLPLIYALTAKKINTLGELRKVLDEIAGLIPQEVSDIKQVLDAGACALLAEEAIEAVRYLQPNPYTSPWIGFVPDRIIRELGIKLVDGRIPGIALIVGAPESPEISVKIIRELQERNILSLVVGSSSHGNMAEQLLDNGVELSLDTYIVPLGEEVSSCAHAANLAVRAAMTFGGIYPDKDGTEKIVKYCQERVPVFILVLGEDENERGNLLVDEKFATAAGALNLNFPVITPLDIPEVPGAIFPNVETDKIVSRALEIKGIKVKFKKMPIPVPYGSGFEGERVRKANMWVELGGREKPSVELLIMKEMDEVEDGKIEITGPDIDQVEEKSSLPLAFVVEVAGKKMHKDFENVLERHIHHFLSCINGVMHTGQRTILWHRISKEAYEAGLRLKHLAKVVELKLKDEFSAIVDKVQVTIATDEQKVRELIKFAEPIFKERDDRILGMTDEEVDVFYSCVLCIPEGEYIILSDGSFRRIERFIYEDEAYHKVFSLNGGSLEKIMPNDIMISPAPQKIMRITFNNGSFIRVTANHKILTEEPYKGFVWKEARNIKKADIVVSPTYPCEIKSSRFSPFIIDYLDENLLVSDDSFLQFLRAKILEKFGTFSRAAKSLGIDYYYLYRGFYYPEGKKISHRRFSISKMKEICSKIGIWEDCRKMITQFSNINSRSCKLKQVVLTPDLLYLAGLVAADGFVYKRKTGGRTVRFVNTRKELIDLFIEKVKMIIECSPKIRSYQPGCFQGRTITVNSKKKGYIVIVNNLLFGKILEGLGVSVNGVKWDLEKISSLPSELVISFIRGLFDGDGHVTESHTAISCKRERQALQLYLLFKKIGINTYISSTTRGFQVYTRNRLETIKFKELIGCNHHEKKRRFKNIHIKKDKFHTIRSEIIPYFVADKIFEIIKSKRITITKLPIDYKNLKAWVNRKIHPTVDSISKIISWLEKNGYQDWRMEEVKRWLELKLQALRVKEIRKERYSRQAVFNLAIPNYHNYLINGIVVKNCQSYAPNHVCIVSPERLGLCGAYTWIDCKASYEMNPKGANQPIEKGNVIDPERGEWEGINKFVYEKSNRAIERVHHYSIMSYPETSCCVADTNLFIDNQLTTFGEFFEEVWGTEKYLGKRCLTLDGNYKTSEDKIIALQKFKAPRELVRIETKTGLELIVTPDHKIPIDTPDGICWLKAEDLKIGDRLFSLKKINIPVKIPSILELLPDDFRIKSTGIIKEMREFLRSKYGSIKEGELKLGVSFHYRKESISLRELRKLIGGGFPIEKLHTCEYEVGRRTRYYKRTSIKLRRELFYLLGLIASDGSLTKVGRSEYKITFVNTQPELVRAFISLTKRIFPRIKIWVSKNKKCITKIEGRKVKSKKVCYRVQLNDPLFGALAEGFGLGPRKEDHNFKLLFGLPEDYIASFIAGIFDGDGSVRLRKYKGKWEHPEIYIPVKEKKVAVKLSLLLRRIGIVPYIKKSKSLYKLYIYSENAYRFSYLVQSMHPLKVEKLMAIKVRLRGRDGLTKCQQNVLPYVVGKELVKIREGKDRLAATTCFYYSKFKSRPILANVLKIGEELLSPTIRKFISCDVMLDSIKEIKKISANGFDYVYNLTLSDIHSYFANGIWIANCGCFECIVGVIPEANGVMIVNREFQGETPLGMTFSNLAGSVGGGNQVPGFLGIGKLFITSKKFIKADGGIRRIVWMPRQLKEEIKERFAKRAEEEGVPDLLDKIGDEETAPTLEDLLSYLEKVRHPALSMPPILEM